MMRTRWLALQGATVVLTVAAVSSVRAQGRCPFLMQAQMQLNARFTPPMMGQQMNVPQFHMPNLTPPRMPMGFRPVGQPAQPQHNLGFSSLPRIHTPEINLNMVRTQEERMREQRTEYLTRLHTDMHSMHVPTLEWHTHGWFEYHPNWVHGYGTGGGPGHGDLTWRLSMGLKHFPSLGFHTVSWETHHTSITARTVEIEELRRREEIQRLRIPSLSFEPRRPTLTARFPISTGPKTGPGLHTDPKVNVARNDPKTTTTATKPGSAYLHVSGKLSMTCGSCHTCKGTPHTGLIAQQQTPAPRLPALPALTPVAARPQLTYLNSSPVVTQPFAPLVLLPAPQTPPSLTFTPSLLAALSSPPKMTPSPGQSQFGLAPTADSNALVSTPLPSTALVTALPEMVAELNPPSLQKVERPAVNQVQLPTLAEVFVPAEPERPVATRGAGQQGPSLIYVLLEPPQLPSGALVAPREFVGPALDEPAVLPALVDTLIQPPPVPPVPGA